MHMVPILRPPVQKILRRFQKRFPRNHLDHIINFPLVASPDRRTVRNAIAGIRMHNARSVHKIGIAICVKSAFESISKPNSKSIISVILAFAPVNVIRTLVAVKCESNRYKSCWNPATTVETSVPSQFFTTNGIMRLLYPTPVPPVGSALCPSISMPFTKIASTRVG